MAAQSFVRAKEDRRLWGKPAAQTVDLPFLALVLLLLTLGLVMLYSASYAQSEYDTGYAISTRYLQKQAGVFIWKLWKLYDNIKKNNEICRNQH